MTTILAVLACTVIVAVPTGLALYQREIAARWRRWKSSQEPLWQLRDFQQLVADVRRLRAELSAIPSGTPMAKRRALEGAYEDVLLDVARTLDIETGAVAMHHLSGPDREAERLRLETRLVAAGVALDGVTAE